MTIQDQIQISLIRTANDITLANARTLYASIPSPSVRFTGDAYIPSRSTAPITYTPSAKPSR